MSSKTEGTINAQLRRWRQGDVSLDAGLEFIYLADQASISTWQQSDEKATLSLASEQNTPSVVPILEEIRGVAMLTQTCDIIRDCQVRPFVEVAPLVELEPHVVEEVRRLKRPRFAYVSATAHEGLVADLDRTMTVEKAVVAHWTRIAGLGTEQEARDFALALSRKRSRFAFPDDFTIAARDLQRRIVATHNRQTAEGAHLRSLIEIRVRAAPSWDNKTVELDWWFIKENDPEDTPSEWSTFVALWIDLFEQTGRFKINSWTACRLQDISAQDYVESDHLDLDRLSVSAPE